MGAVVMMSMIASVPVKFVVTKIAADVLGSGDRVTTARFALVCFLTAFSSPLLTAIWDNLDMGNFAALILGSVSAYGYRHMLWRKILSGAPRQPIFASAL
mmetsp:Transcript_36391/g.53387  ORF Transcript_36391/g.53387 Transcript_36391/m.53387 type:complete len:100 (-) Transcript_36391:189-488(-)